MFKNKKSWIKSIEVDSSYVQRISYNSKNQTLFVLFSKNLEEMYCYSKVPESLFLKMIKAPSAGEFLNRYVRGKYRTDKVLIQEAA